MQVIERRGTEIGAELAELNDRRIDAEELRVALAQFDPAWNTLSPREQERLHKLLLERIADDGQAGTGRTPLP